MIRRERRGPFTTFMIGGIVVPLVTAILLIGRVPPDREPLRPPLGQQSASCMECHTGIESMHADEDDEIGITCVDCHGGNGSATTRQQAHVLPRQTDVFASSANPVRSYTALNEESLEFVRFMNPGDFRAARQACGACHGQIVNRMMSSIMGTGALVAQAATYNNGILPLKVPQYGEAYLPDGTPAIIRSTLPDQTAGLLDMENRGPTSLVPKMEPLPRFQIIPGLDPFRVLERGNNDAGTRARGTDFKVAGGGLALHKTRLNDPTLWFLGTNQLSGDYRSSGCAACHVLYANDRDTLNAGPEVTEYYRGGGQAGGSGSADASIPKGEAGHPIAHRFTTRIPVSQCLSCHHHQGNGALGTYTGVMWWDQETEADKLLGPDVHRDYGMSPTALSTLWEQNDTFDDLQFSDLHGHSWNFRKVYKRDRQGRLLDDEDNLIPEDDPAKFDRAVHLKDIHLERGMHCIDCHTEQDVHGDGRLWGATPDPIEITCIDCHGTASERATLVTSGINGGHNLADRLSGPRTAFGTRTFEIDGARVIQRSKLYEDLEWLIPQLIDRVDPDVPVYNERAAKAHTMQRDGSWGDVSADPSSLAHAPQRMECYTCHTSWNTGCYGCHLPADLNTKQAAKHYEGQTTRGQVDYNPQVLRTDNFLLGLNSSSKGNKFSPIRSASSVFATVTGRNRQVIVHQQPTVSTPGYSGFAFAPNIPHTVRTKETMQCTDCHLSGDQDNNAWMASVLGQGTNTLSFIGQYAHLALGGSGVQAVEVTQGNEPQPVIGSNLHSILYPDDYQRMVDGGRRLSTAHGVGTTNATGLAARGEYVFVADGSAGLRIIDRANVANKNEAQRLVVAQSGMGEQLQVKTRDATAVGLPSNVPMNLDRTARPENLELPIAALFRYAYVTDRQEGLVVVDVNTLHDGDPSNNFLERAITYNPDGRLSGAVNIKIAGNYALILSETSGLHVVDISNPRSPQWRADIGPPAIRDPRSVHVQFRYAFVADADGVKVVDITDPTQPRLVEDATIELDDARDVVPVRSYLYVAAGSDGLAIVNIEEPEDPVIVDRFTAGGVINDATALTTGSVNASLFAFVAGGVNGLQVVRLIGPPDTPGHQGFSPAPVPRLIASYQTKGPAVAIADGPSRDRVVDESGNQIGVMGRLGSRPLGAEDRARLLRYNGRLFFVDNDGTVRFQN